jgi:hypothetical protein
MSTKVDNLQEMIWEPTRTSRVDGKVVRLWSSRKRTKGEMKKYRGFKEVVAHEGNVIEYLDSYIEEEEEESKS